MTYWWPFHVSFAVHRERMMLYPLLPFHRRCIYHLQKSYTQHHYHSSTLTDETVCRTIETFHRSTWRSARKFHRGPIDSPSGNSRGLRCRCFALLGDIDFALCHRSTSAGFLNLLASPRKRVGGKGISLFLWKGKYYVFNIELPLVLENIRSQHFSLFAIKFASHTLLHHGIISRAGHNSTTQAI